MSTETLVERVLRLLPGATAVPSEHVRGDAAVILDRGLLLEGLRTLRDHPETRFEMLTDLTVVDYLGRVPRFEVVYQLTSLTWKQRLRVKVPVPEDDPVVASAVTLWQSANWAEREAWDLFGITFDGHPHMRRILLPSTWKGHPLRKEYHARATEFDPFQLDALRQDQEQEALRFQPEEWGMRRATDDHDYMFLNLGPNHPSAHGAFRIVLQLDGEEIVDCVPDIGYHHRGAEKMGERQSWHSYIPYTDRVDYLGGVMNNLPYVLALEKLAGIEVPDRVKTIRVMLCEIFRILSHLLYYGTFFQDVGAMTPVFITFVDRQKGYDVIEAITGFRMHPAWFRIGGVAHDLPTGWERLVRDFIEWMPKRLRDYRKSILRNSIVIARSRDVAAYDTDEALEWGITGAGLRATGLGYDLRKARPYSGYENFEFDIPTGSRGDVYDRTLVREEEMHQSLRIIEQCLNNMPSGPYKADHPLTCPPPKDRTLRDIDTLIPHFLGVSWGPVMPAGETSQLIEATKGIAGYSLISDGSTMSYRTRLRTPSFAHLQQIPSVIRGQMVPDLIAYIASIDFVMSDVDR